MKNDVKKIPNEYFQTIGEISSNLSLTEFTILYCISLLCCDELEKSDFSETLCLAGGEGFEISQSKLDKLFRLNVGDNKLLEKFNIIKERLTEVNKHRNKYVHSVWTSFEGSVLRIKFPKKMNKVGLLREIEENVPIQPLKDLAEEVSNVTKDLFDFFMGNLTQINFERKERLSKESGKVVFPINDSKEKKA
jgi:hypothetical protein